MEESVYKDESSKPNVVSNKLAWLKEIPRLGITTALVLSFILFPVIVVVIWKLFDVDDKELINLISLWFGELKAMVMIAVSFHLSIKTSENITKH